MLQSVESIWARLGKALQRQMDVGHEPLPRRWVELIHLLNEQERERPSLPKGEDQVERAALPRN
jgi:hypothetical protein